jgi:hypothetical protein
LLDLYIRRDRRKEALDLIGRIYPATPLREALRSAVRGACLAGQQNWIPALAYLQTAFGAGCRDVICLRGLVTAYLATGDLIAADRTLAEWRKQHPASGEIARFECELQNMRRDSSGRSDDTPHGIQKPDSPADRRLRLDVQPETHAPAAPKVGTRVPTWDDIATSH